MKQQKLETPKGKLNELIIHETVRPNGTKRYQLDFSNCPTLAEQHTAHLTDINYLIEKYKPDELAAYIAARSQYRQEILDHDFSKEPNLQDSMNVVYQSKQTFNELPDHLKMQFKNHVEFLKFIDNPANAEKLTKFGLITKGQLEKLQIPDTSLNLSTNADNAERSEKADKETTKKAAKNPDGRE